MISKVTVIAFHPFDSGRLLLLGHPDGGHQLISGTVERRESPLDAARRECLKESGKDLENAQELHRREEQLGPGAFLLLQDSPEATAKALRRGHTVRVLTERNGLAMVEEPHYDLEAIPPRPKRKHTGTIATEHLGEVCERVVIKGNLTERKLEESWTHVADGQVFRFSWAAPADLPDALSQRDRESLRHGGLLRNP